MAASRRLRGLIPGKRLPAHVHSCGRTHVLLNLWFYACDPSSRQSVSLAERLTSYSIECLHSLDYKFSSSVDMPATCTMQPAACQAVSVCRAGSHPRSFLPCNAPRSRYSVQKRAVRVHAQQQQQQQEKPQVAQFADSIGLPTEEGLFGFKPFPEVCMSLTSYPALHIQAGVSITIMLALASQVWVGRLAMMGFLTSIIEEAITKKGTLGQVGFIVPSPPLLYTILGAATATTLTSLAVTIYNAQTGQMTARYSCCCSFSPLFC